MALYVPPAIVVGVVLVESSPRFVEPAAAKRLAVAIAALVGGIIYGELGAAPLFLLSAAVLFGAVPFAWRVLR